MKIREIASRNNHDFGRFQRVLKGRGIRKLGLTLISGPKQVQEVLREFPDRCEGVILGREHAPPVETIPGDARVYRLSAELFREVDVYGTDHPILLVRAGRFPSWNQEERTPGCTLFIPFQDPANVGAVIRSAAAFDVPRVVILRESAHPMHHKAGRVAGTALFRVSLFQGPAILDLADIDLPLITLSPDGQDIGIYQFPPFFGLLPGLEGPGLPDELRGRTSLAIPMAPGIESLNAASATAVALYVWRSRQEKARRGAISGESVTFT